MLATAVSYLQCLVLLKSCPQHQQTIVESKEVLASNWLQNCWVHCLRIQGGTEIPNPMVKYAASTALFKSSKSTEIFELVEWPLHEQ